MRKFKVTVNGKTFEVDVEEKEIDMSKAKDNVISKESSESQEELEAPMPGEIYKVLVSEGDDVESGEVLMILEAMKMENEIVSPVDGQVKSILVEEGSMVDTGELLIIIN